MISWYPGCVIDQTTHAAGPCSFQAHHSLEREDLSNQPAQSVPICISNVLPPSHVFEAEWSNSHQCEMGCVARPLRHSSAHQAIRRRNVVQ
jgi:hypothetical protein